MSTTVFSPTLKPLRVIHPKAVRHPKIDCFYVYPTVSDETTVNSDLVVATPSPTPEWGLQLVDANIELGNLLSVVKSEAMAFARVSG